jgi:metal-sulfur cluster biosynthetic enzyme
VSSPESTTTAVWQALEGVIDPCSRFNGSCLSLVSLGMVEDVSVDPEGAAHIQLLLDDPTCPFFADIHKQVGDAVLAVPGITGARVALRGDALWTRERMTVAARAKLERRTAAAKSPA